MPKIAIYYFMKMHKLTGVLLIILLFLAPVRAPALDLSDPYIFISGLFDSIIDPNGGRTAFRSLLIPGGGRSEAMGSAFTALADDISFFETNPAGSSTMKNTELAVFHNSWIADSRLETIAFTKRADSLGYGASLRSFYVPFTEYNTFGERVSRGYYTETLAVFNVSYNFLSGYYFKGIATGMNLKVGFRGVPDFSDNYGNIQEGSGISQSAATIMADIGMQTRFNLLKLYSSRDPNFFIGFTGRNIGPPVLDEALPTLFTLGAAYKPANPLVISAEIQQPVNLLNIAESEDPVLGAGFALEFTNFLALLGGFQLKGANPRVSVGTEINVDDLQFNINYTLDLTTQAAIFNRISLAAKLNLGDSGRAELRKKTEILYLEGMRLYASGQLSEAILVWKETLLMDKRFDPAREGIATAELTLAIQQQIRDLQQLE